MGSSEGFPGGSDVKNLPAVQETWVPSLGGKMLWRMGWLLPPVFLPGKSHGQRSLEGYSPVGRRESDVTEQQAHIQDPVKVPSLKSNASQLIHYK